jgi:acyl transferase domain-containing protein
MSEQEHEPRSTGIAIIGMAGRFPGAPDLATYWRNLRDGIESITFFEKERLEAAGVPEAVLNEPSYVRARGTLAGADQFDAGFFGCSPREATIMDPQHRVFLECSWEALESAGYDPKGYRGLIGVYGGSTTSSYTPLVYADRAALSQSDPLAIAIGNEMAFLTTRVSYKLDLRGPSCPVQTACSTSLVAIHLACQGLLNAECDMAIAGGVSIRVPQESGYFYQAAGILSPDGRCRSFDSKAQGTLFSNGIGIVVLKRLDDALADGDFIHAVVLGSAINNDGSHKASFTAPAVGGQSDVIADALMNAEVEPESISYVEAHGTATALGDSIEMQALGKVFSPEQGRHYCKLGSVKSNLGHLDAASGVAGLIKTVLAMQHRQLPPSLHFERPNADIDFANSAFVVNHTLSPWLPGEDAPLRAGVSSFGFGGTNAHIILEEAPEAASSGPSRPWQLLTLSAETVPGLDTATANLAAHLRAHPAQPIADVAFTLQTGRRGFRQRRAVVCRTGDEASAALDSRDPAAVFTGSAEGERPVVFLFPGQGAQHVNMGRELYDHEPAFRAAVDDCAERLRTPLGFDIRDAIYPAQPDAAADERLRRTSVAQPAIFVIEYALARCWMAWGVKPEACLGHSIGEFVAACLAGVMTLDDALALVALRGSLMEQMAPGVMLAAPLPEDRVQRLLAPGLWLSVVNAPSSCVVSGSADAIAGFEQRLQADGVECQRLHTSHAFHSGLMDPAVPAFVSAVARVTLRPPSLPYISNVTGRWIEPSQATDPAYWGRQLREAVRFGDGVTELLKRESRLFLEVGPGQTLAPLVRHQARGRAAQAVVSSMRHVRQQTPDGAALMAALGRLWVNGVDVAWTKYYGDEQRRRVPLPTYPFQRQRYWVNPSARPAAAAREERPSGKIADVSRWFYTPAWTRSVPPARAALPASPAMWLVFGDAAGPGAAAAAALRAAGQRVAMIEAGDRFARGADGSYRVTRTTRADYEAVVNDLPNGAAVYALHCWSVGAAGDEAAVASAFRDARERGFDSLLALAQSLGRAAGRLGPIRVGLVTSGAQDVTGEEALSPGAAIALGLCRVISQEYPEIDCKSIDLAAGPAGSGEGRWAEWLVNEMLSERGERMVAYRGVHRWVLGYQPAPLSHGDERPPQIADRAVVLITGGLGDIGLHIAEYFARTVKARVVLTGRTPMPDPSQWDGYLSVHPSADAMAQRIRRLQRVAAHGGEALYLRADSSVPAEMQAAFEAAEARFGRVDTVVHAAGLVTGDAFRPIDDSDAEICARQFAPKIVGLCVLDQVMRGRPMPPERVILISSLSSLLGGLRFAAYASANAFLDAFAAWRRRTGRAQWLTINWDSWLRVEDELRGAPSGIDLIMTGAEGVEAFHRVLGSDLGTQVAVSVGDLQARIDQWVKLEKVHAEQEGTPDAPTMRHPRPNLQTEYQAPSDDLERALASIWEELLGIERVGVNDSFFELGGDSLLGVQVIARIKRQLAVAVSAVGLYEGPTVALLAGVVRASGKTDQLDQSKRRGDKRREQKMRSQLQTAG